MLIDTTATTTRLPDRPTPARIAAPLAAPQSGPALDRLLEALHAAELRAHAATRGLADGIRRVCAAIDDTDADLARRLEQL
ncbi:hypothetical protein [Corynebacterium sp. 13CS0277]|uniref:hypothetical protein n=1 Tax=Corynebacterium sp. 13CS0277 TaxID=2071994 RepID=UPI0011B205A2|nr:hypothetical protein [Corynebacterium sp. 13CS0277]